MRKTSWGLFHWETMTTQAHKKIACDDIKEAFLAKEWNSFHLLCKKVDYLHLKVFSNNNVNYT